MAGGRIFRGNKKKVLSNKALTKRVRSLTGIEGKRDGFVLSIFNNVTLVVNTQEIIYINLKQFVDTIIHKIRVNVAITAPASCYFRLMLLEDQRDDAPDLTGGDILVQELPWAGYATTDIQPFSSKRLEKNLAKKFQGRIVKDMLFAMNFDVTAEKKMFKFDVPFNGRKIDGSADWLISCISDVACIVDIQVSVDRTTLPN